MVKKYADTKDKIFQAAVRLFSDRGYNNVSMREIAASVNVKVSAIYNHYASKEDILKSLYKYYSDNLQQVTPKLNTLLKEAETLPPHEVFKKLDFHFDPEIEETADRIIAISIMQYRSDKYSARFIYDNLLAISENLLLPLLKRMIELKKIEPIDIDAFHCLISSFAFGAAIRNHSEFAVTLKTWQNAFNMAFSLIKPC